MGGGMVEGADVVGVEVEDLRELYLKVVYFKRW